MFTIRNFKGEFLMYVRWAGSCLEAYSFGTFPEKFSKAEVQRILDRLPLCLKVDRA